MKCVCVRVGAVKEERKGESMRGLGLSLPILCEQGECLTCVWVAVVWVV